MRTLVTRNLPNTLSHHHESLGALLKETASQASLELRLNPLFPTTENLRASQ